MRKRDDIDDVIVMPAAFLDGSTLEETLQDSLERMGDLAKRRGMECPVTVRLVDSDGKNVAKYVLLKFELRPDAIQHEKIESDYANLSGELAMPVFWVVED